MAYIYDLADTWADGATTFTAIKMNVTNTASAAASNLMDLQVGGVSRFRVGRGGTITVPDETGIEASNGPTGVQFFANNVSRFGRFDRHTLGVLGAASLTNGYFQFGFSTDAFGGGTVVRLAIDAANTLGQRNGVNAQAFNLYNTYTDASNYERGFMRYVSNRLEIGHEAAGTGSLNRAIAFRTSGFDALVLSNSEGARFNVNLVLLTASINSMRNINNQDGYTQMQETTAPAAPSADRVRIYAEDDGAGKTRLMARFATGAAVQLAIEP